MNGLGWLAALVGGALLWRHAAAPSLPAPQGSPHDLAKPLPVEQLKPLADALLPAAAGTVTPDPSQAQGLQYLYRATPVPPGMEQVNPDPARFAVARDWTGAQALVRTELAAARPVLPTYEVPASIRTDQRGADAQVASGTVRAFEAATPTPYVSARPSADHAAFVAAGRPKDAPASKPGFRGWCDEGTCVPGGWFR